MSFLLSFWLATLFVVGQGAHVPRFMVWGVGLAALFAGLGGMIAPLVGPRLRLAAPVALSLGLFALWAIGLWVKTPRWLPWCTFLGAIWYLGVVLAEAAWSPRNRGTMAPADA